MATDNRPEPRIVLGTGQNRHFIISTKYTPSLTIWQWIARFGNSVRDRILFKVVLDNGIEWISVIIIVAVGSIRSSGRGRRRSSGQTIRHGRCADGLRLRKMVEGLGLLHLTFDSFINLF
jgi:hypothetical protein